MTTTLTPQAFVAKWRSVALHERGQAQEHFMDLCRLLDQPTPAEADPSRTWYAFEAGATKATGGRGWADVWKRDCFAWEYKGDHADLDKAYGQLSLHMGVFAHPPLLIVCDDHRLRIHTHFTDAVGVTYEFTADHPSPLDKLDLLHNAFIDPEALRTPPTTALGAEQAAAQFARIAQVLRRSTTRCETFSWPPNHVSAGDPCVEAIAQAARGLGRWCVAWLNPPDANEADLKRRTLTNLYNARPAWLDLAHLSSMPQCWSPTASLPMSPMRRYWKAC